MTRRASEDFRTSPSCRDVVTRGKCERGGHTLSPTHHALAVLPLVLAMACGGRVETGGASSDGTGGIVSGGTGGVLSGGTGGIASGGASGSTGTSPCNHLDTNPDHCGACDHSCLGGQCVGGVCQPVVLEDLGKQGAYALALDATRVYWASPITRMNKDGTGVTKMADAPSGVWGIAVDADQIFWSDPDSGSFRMKKTGGGSVPIGKAAYRIALDSKYVYGSWQEVWKTPKEGGPFTTLAPVGGEGIALDDKYVYFTTWMPGGVWKVEKTGGAPVELAKADNSSYVAVYGNTVYWSVQGENYVASVKRSGGAVKVLAKASTPYGIAADADGVYWTEFDTGTIWMLPAGSTTPLPLASGQFAPRDLAVDATAVYWTNDASKSAVSKVAKPAKP